MAKKISELTAATAPAETDVMPIVQGIATKKATVSAWVRGALLTGLSIATNAAISASDSVLVAFGKLQAQITGMLSSLNGHIGNTTNAHGMTTPGAAIVQAATEADQRAAMGLVNHEKVEVDSSGGVSITSTGSNAGLRKFDTILHAGAERTFTLTADFNYTCEIVATMVGNAGSSIEQIKVILGRRDYSGAPHLSALANIVGTAGYANITFSDSGELRTWNVTVGHLSGGGNFHWMIETKTSGCAIGIS